MTDIVVAIDLRAQFGPARNQGARPTCLAFATSDAHAALRTGWMPLSCEYAFYQAQHRAGLPPSAGARLSATLDALRHDGQPEEIGWPYLPETPADPASWAPPADVGPLFGRASTITHPALAQIIDQLEHARPVLILLTLSRAFYRPDHRAVVWPAPGETPEPARRHAVVAVGHGTVEAQPALLIRNSWGARWGDAGYAWLTESFLAPRIFAAATLMEEVDVPAGSPTA